MRALATRITPRAASLDGKPTQPNAQVHQGSLRRGNIERHGPASAQKLTGIQPSQDQIGVGDGRLLTAASVADRTWHRAGALRPDPQAAACVHPRQAASAGADGVNVDDRQAQGQTRLLRFLWCAELYRGRAQRRCWCHPCQR